MINKNKYSSKYWDYLMAIPKEVYLEALENCISEIHIYDANGNFIYVTPSALSRYGLTPEEIIFNYKNCKSFFQGRFYPLLLPHCVQEKKIIFGKQKYLITNEELYASTVPVFDQNNDIKYIIGETHPDIHDPDISFYCGNEKISKKETVKRTEIVGNSYIFFKTVSKIKQAANSNIPILLLGESGTGKTMLAEYIHKNSPQVNNPFVTINCTAIPDSLLESELFGYVPGAFTGANSKGKRGLLDEADGGTLFLDEIGELPLNLQVKLLDVLENHRFIPVGGTKIKKVKIRIITATNKNIENEVLHNRFREDLYWRINTYSIKIPPLRERKDDILPLASFFLKKFNEQYQTNKTFSSKLIHILLSDPWKGNVRQLKNLIERVVILTKGNVIEVDSLPEYMIDNNRVIDEKSYDQMISDYKKSIIRYFYDTSKNIGELSKKLSLTRSRAYNLVNLYCDQKKSI